MLLAAFKDVAAAAAVVVVVVVVDLSNRSDAVTFEENYDSGKSKSTIGLEKTVRTYVRSASDCIGGAGIKRWAKNQINGTLIISAV